ncbi:MAG: serine hydrolase [Planctomycetaceae bacterium]
MSPIGKSKLVRNRRSSVRFVAVGLSLLLFVVPAGAGAQPPAAEELAAADPLTGPPLTTAKAWIIGDGKTGEPLWEHESHAVRNMASTTKMMTCWIVVELARENEAVLDEVVTISERADKTSGSTADVRVGEKVSVRDLLYGLMLPSGNDAATAFGEHFGDRFDPPEGKPEADSLDRFIAEMNRRAKALEMRETKYLDPHGNSRNASSARDLFKLAWTARENPLFREYVGTRSHACKIARPDGGERGVTWKNTNQLLAIEGFEGVKTGTTGAAGECLVSCGRRGEDCLLIVVLGSATGGGRYVDSRNLYRWAWRQRGHQQDAGTGR